MNENSIESFKPLSREDVIRSLKENPENFELWDKYIVARGKETENKSQHLSQEENLELSLKLNTELAEILEESGLYEMAITAYEDILDELFQQKKDYTAIDNKINELVKKLENKT